MAPPLPPALVRPRLNDPFTVEVLRRLTYERIAYVVGFSSPLASKVFSRSTPTVLSNSDTFMVPEAVSLKAFSPQSDIGLAGKKFVVYAFAGIA